MTLRGKELRSTAQREKLKVNYFKNLGLSKDTIKSKKTSREPGEDTGLQCM